MAVEFRFVVFFLANGIITDRETETILLDLLPQLLRAN